MLDIVVCCCFVPQMLCIYVYACKVESLGSDLGQTLSHAYKSSRVSVKLVLLL